MAQRADDRRIRSVLQLRSEWRARDIEAKVRLSGNPVGNVAVAIAVADALDPDRFGRIAARARGDEAHVRALAWAPRVRRDQLAAFEQAARTQGLRDYRIFDVTPDFRRTELGEREEYFPVLFDVRVGGNAAVNGLALGRYPGRAEPMRKARDEGRPVATQPVAPVGPPTTERVYLLFWPVYAGIEVPVTAEERRDRLRGYAVGTYLVSALLSAAIRDTPALVETIHFSISAAHRENAAEAAVAVYSPTTRSIQPGAQAGAADPPAVRLVHRFAAFDQHWDLTFDYSAAAVAELRSQGAWGWLLAGFLLTALLVFYLMRERGRTEAVEALVAERTAELQRTSEQLHQAQKMEAIGNLTGGMAHDFNNLLTVVIGNLDLLQDKLKGDPKAVALADAALEAGLRGAELTRQLLAFARRQTLAPRLTDINALVVGMTRLLKRILEANIEITLVTAPDLWPAMIDPAQLSSAITNLATNARDAMPAGGRLTIETQNTQLDADYAARHPGVAPGDFVLLQVSDTGAGMSAATIERAFEPFFTTKEVGRGTGLGLSMVFGFVRQSQGHIKIYSEVGQGTVVRLYLPRAQHGAPAAPAEPATPVQLERGHATILVVEDNPDVRAAVVRQLGEMGYAVLEAETADAALTLLKGLGTKIDLLFTDLVMPGSMNGHDLARTALAERPGLKVLFTSGYPGNSLRGNDRLAEGEHFLGKPYRKHDLARKLHAILGE